MLDYACVSLSDLLIPWEVILRRLEAVAAADFVIALHNVNTVRIRKTGKARTPGLA